MSDEGSRLFDETLIARRRVRLWTAAAVGAVLLLRVLGEVAPLMRRPDVLLLDAWQARRAPRASGQVVIVAIDEKSIGKFGPPPWPRSEYVPLVERLSKAGAKVIGFDYTFGALEREAANNQLLAEAVRKAGNVVFGYEFTRVGDPSRPGTAPSAAVQASALPAEATGRLIAVPPAPELIEPEPVLAEAAAAIGHVRAIEGDDGRLRRLPLVIQHGDRLYPSFGLQLARLYQGVALKDVAVSGSGISFPATLVEIPVKSTGEVLLNWPADGELAFPRYSFLDVVRGDVPDDAFHGKVVLVAGTASGLDDRDFPFASKAPGVLVYATLLDNVFRADFVREPTWGFVFEWALLLGVCGLAVWLLPRLPTRALLVGVPLLALGLLGVAAFLFVVPQPGLWVPSFYPVLALLVPLGVVVVLRLNASEKETRDVHAEKQEESKEKGLSFQQQGMLDMALATFNKLPMSEDMKLIYLNLGLDFENRGQRDKAFLAYKKVFDVDPSYQNVAARIEKLRAAGAGTGAYVPPTILPTAMPQSVPLPSQRPGAAPHAGGLYATAAPATAVSGEAPTELAPGAGAGTPPAAYQSPIPQQTPGPRQTPMAGSMAPGASMTAAPGGGPLVPGSRIGKYEIEKHLGRGGMGDVYLVRDVKMNRRAALKTIREDNSLDSRQVIELRQRFYREAQTAGQLNHPNIVTVYEADEAMGMSYIVMEFVEGQTLAQLMKKQRLTIAQIKHVVYHAAMGLDFAHKNGVFHRDVKPDNIMVSKTGNVKVMDFGIARVVESQLTQTGSVMGTPAYMSPEQVNGKKVDQRSDVFSLGVILYELLTGKKPFSGDTVSSLMFAIVKNDPAQPSALDAKIGTTWDQILAKALAKHPEQRYASARELAAAVRDAK